MILNAYDGGFFTLGSSQVETEIFITNPNPRNNSIWRDINTLNLTIDVNNTDGWENYASSKYVNISITNETGHLYYTNYTPSSNGTFWNNGNGSFNGFLIDVTYTWYVNTSYRGIQNNTQFNFSINPVYDTIQNNGYDYFVWRDSNSTLSDVAGEIDGFDEADEFVAVWNKSTWVNNEGCWIKYYGDGSGDLDANVNKLDIIYTYLTDAGFQEIGAPVNYTPVYNRTVNLTYLGTEGNKGYNYTAYTCNIKTEGYSLNISDISSNIGLQTGEVVSWWDNSTQEWKAWIEGVSHTDYDYTINTDSPIIETKVNNNYSWVISCR
jgi:hypothetical protein